MAGYSETPLIKKLGIKEGMTIALIGTPALFRAELGVLPKGVKESKLGNKNADYIHYFSDSKKEFIAAITKLKKALKSSGMIWISWPKQSSGVTTDLTENIIRETALKAGLVDVKVVAIDEVWSGLKLVYRLKDR